MVLPVTIYPQETIGLDYEGEGSYRVSRKRRSQVKPHNLPLDYEYYKRHCYKVTGTGYQPQAVSNANAFRTYSPEGFFAFSFGPFNEATPAYQDILTDVQNKAVQRFRTRVSDPASLGISLVQYGQAMEMMVKRLTSLVHFTRSLRRGQWKSAWEALEVTPSAYQSLVSKEAKLKSGAKHLANNFLEVHFGWVPLISDIYQSLQILTGPIPYGRITGSAKLPYSVGVGPTSLNFWETLTAKHTGVARCHVGAHVEVTNPNLFLLSSLGLLNPLDVAWDAIPWSFVVGWFVNVQDIIQNMSAYAGCSLSNSYHVVSLSAHCTNTRSNRYPGYAGTSSVSSTAFSLKRGVGIPDLTLRVKGVQLPSTLRGLTAASLLTKFLH